MSALQICGVKRLPDASKRVGSLPSGGLMAESLRPATASMESSDCLDIDAFLKMDGEAAKDTHQLGKGLLVLQRPPLQQCQPAGRDLAFATLS